MVIDDIAAHQTTPYGCSGEVQYVFVAPCASAAWNCDSVAPAARRLVQGTGPYASTPIAQGAKPFYQSVGFDLLGGMSIVTSILLSEYLAGSTIVLMLSGGSVESHALRSALQCWPRSPNGCLRLPTGNGRQNCSLWRWRRSRWVTPPSFFRMRTSPACSSGRRDVSSAACSLSGAERFAACLCRIDATSSHVATAYSPVCSRQSSSPSGRPLPATPTWLLVNRL